MATIPELPASTGLAATDLFIKSQGGETQKVSFLDLQNGINRVYGGIINSGGSITLSGNYVVVIAFYTNTGGVYCFRNDVAVQIAGDLSSQLTISASGTTYTLTNNISNAGIRYIALIV